VYQLAVVSNTAQHQNLHLLRDLALPSIRRVIPEGVPLARRTNSRSAVYYVEHGLVAEFVAHDSNATLVCLCPSGSFAGLNLVPGTQRECHLVTIVPSVIQSLPELLLRASLERENTHRHLLPELARRVDCAVRLSSVLNANVKERITGILELIDFMHAGTECRGTEVDTSILATLIGAKEVSLQAAIDSLVTDGTIVRRGTSHLSRNRMANYLS